VISCQRPKLRRHRPRKRTIQCSAKGLSSMVGIQIGARASWIARFRGQ